MTVKRLIILQCVCEGKIIIKGFYCLSALCGFYSWQVHPSFILQVFPSGAQSGDKKDCYFSICASAPNKNSKEATVCMSPGVAPAWLVQWLVSGLNPSNLPAYFTVDVTKGNSDEVTVE